MKKSTSGFTIVELLIVVVVIGILAAIVIVAYNGITNQAKNAKTISAVNAWAKAIQLYRVEKGSFPPSNSCLGSATTYPDTGIGPYCWDTSYWEVKTAFLNQLAPYISGTPEPDNTQIGPTDFNRRGAFYHIASSTDHRIRAVFSGISTCPASSAGPVVATGVISSGTSGVVCQYSLE